MIVATAQNSCFQYAGDTQGFGLSVETFATDGVSGMTTYRVYMNTPNANDFVFMVIGDQDTPVPQHHNVLLPGRVGRHNAGLDQPDVLHTPRVRGVPV